MQVINKECFKNNMDDVIIQVWCLCVIFWQFQILSRAFYGLCINSIRCKTGGNYLAVCYEYIPSAIFISPLNQVHAIAKKHLKCVSTNLFKLKCYSYVIHIWLGIYLEYCIITIWLNRDHSNTLTFKHLTHMNNTAFYSLLTFRFIGKQNVLCHDSLQIPVEIIVIVSKLCETAIHDFSIKIPKAYILLYHNYSIACTITILFWW